MMGYLTARGFIGLAVAAMLSCSAARPQDASEPPAISFGKRGENRAFANICRYEIADLPPVLSVFEFTLKEGGLTCFTGDHGVLFVPRREANCPRPPGRPVSRRTLSQNEAAEEYLQCSAIASPLSPRSSELTIYRPNPAHPASDGTFIDFLLDVGALVGNDMLPVTRLVQEGDRLCMESPDAHRVARRITEADIAEPSEFLVEFGAGSCREAIRQGS